jgi:hypothetical protein
MIKQWIELPRGCGKSTLLREIIYEKIAEGKRCILLAPYVQRTFKPNELLIQIRTVQLARGYSRNCLYYVDEWDAFSIKDQEWMRVNLEIEVATRTLGQAVWWGPGNWFGPLPLVVTKLWIADARKKLNRS